VEGALWPTFLTHKEKGAENTTGCPRGRRLTKLECVRELPQRRAMERWVRQKGHGRILHSGSGYKKR
jgi:hypothetical protein